MTDRLRVQTQPRLPNGTMLVGLSGWMNGGGVSTGSIEWLVNALRAKKVADVDPEGLYIYSFPGSMELSAEFRPHTEIEDGEIKAFRPPVNAFFAHEKHRLLLFVGREPHLNWREYADGLFSFALQSGVSTIYFIGSVATMVPHSRAPRLISAYSHASMRASLEGVVTRFTNYEGPASISTYLMTEAGGRGLRMASLVAEIPVYIQGTNPKSIHAVLRKLSVLLGFRIRLDRLRLLTDAWEKQVGAALENEPDLSQHIRKLEEDYDHEVFDTQMDDLKQWLQQRGIRVD